MDDSAAAPVASVPHEHGFFAVAYAENFSLRELARLHPRVRPEAHVLRVPLDDQGNIGGEAFLFAFGAVVLLDVPRSRREGEISRLRQGAARQVPEVVREDFVVRVEPGKAIRIEGGALVVDALTPERAGIVALTVAQSAAMEYYERVVEGLFARTTASVERLERRGSMPLSLRPLHRFIAEAVSTRTEVLGVLHLLDKPDDVWDDPAMDRIYADLRGEFDLTERYEALESKLASIQEALGLMLDVARDRRLFLLELAIVLLIVFEIVLTLLKLS